MQRTQATVAVLAWIGMWASSLLPSATCRCAARNAAAEAVAASTFEPAAEVACCAAPKAAPASCCSPPRAEADEPEPAACCCKALPAGRESLEAPSEPNGPAVVAGKPTCCSEAGGACCCSGQPLQSGSAPTVAAPPRADVASRADRVADWSAFPPVAYPSLVAISAPAPPPIGVAGAPPTFSSSRRQAFLCVFRC